MGLQDLLNTAASGLSLARGLGGLIARPFSSDGKKQNGLAAMSNDEDSFWSGLGTKRSFVVIDPLVEKEVKVRFTRRGKWSMSVNPRRLDNLVRRLSDDGPVTYEIVLFSSGDDRNAKSAFWLNAARVEAKNKGITIDESKVTIHVVNRPAMGSSMFITYRGSKQIRIDYGHPPKGSSTETHPYLVVIQDPSMIAVGENLFEEFKGEAEVAFSMTEFLQRTIPFLPPVDGSYATYRPGMMSALLPSMRVRAIPPNNRPEPTRLSVDNWDYFENGDGHIGEFRVMPIGPAMTEADLELEPLDIIER